MLGRRFPCDETTESNIYLLMTNKGWADMIKSITAVDRTRYDPRQANLVLIAYASSEHRRFRRACASAQSRQNLRCSLIQAVSQEEPSDRKPDPWPLWMAGHTQLKFVMTECSKTQIRLTGLIYLPTAFHCCYWFSLSLLWRFIGFSLFWYFLWQISK